MVRFRIALLSLCVLCAFFSCQKMSLEDADMASPDSANGNLTINVTQIENGAFMTYTRADLAEACSRLNFVVYNMLGSRIKQVNQQVGNAGFGSASFELDEGDYQFVVLAHSSNGNPTLTNPSKIQFTNSQGFSDTFLCLDTVTIGKDPIRLDVTLNRIVSLCRFTVPDDYPLNATKIKFYYTGGSGAFDAKTGLGCVNSKQELTFSLTSGQRQFDLYTFLHNIEGTIRLKVTYYDSRDDVLSEVSYDVPMRQNRITRVPDAGKEGVSVAIDTDWEQDNLFSF